MGDHSLSVRPPSATDRSCPSFTQWPSVATSEMRSWTSGVTQKQNTLSSICFQDLHHIINDVNTAFTAVCLLFFESTRSCYSFNICTASCYFSNMHVAHLSLVTGPVTPQGRRGAACWTNGEPVVSTGSGCGQLFGWPRSFLLSIPGCCWSTYTSACPVSSSLGLCPAG